MRNLFILGFGLCLLMSSHTVAGLVYSPTFASWTEAGSGSATGTLGSTNFNVTGFDLSIESWDMSNPTWYAAPGSETQQSLSFNQGNYSDQAGLTTTITFDTAVSDFALYTLYWRPQTYSLVAKDASDNNVSYSFLSGSLTPTPTVSNNSFVASGWLSGIIQFSDAVKSITFNTEFGPGGTALLTLATLEANAIPEPSAFFSVSLALIGLSFVRRR